MLRLAIQSKGRLSDESTALLREIGIDLDDSHRKFLLEAPNFPLELLYLRDDDIPQVVSDGTAALGIVGLNEVVERGLPVEIVKKLGFGACRLSLAVPKGAGYNGPEWFRGKRIATSYPRILGDWLKEKGIDAKVQVITGSVEVAPAAGIADAIFDIVSSGGTLVANGLQEVEKVFFSEAVLISSGKLSPEGEEILREMLFRMLRDGLLSRRMAFSLIWRTRSRVRPKRSPISSRVISWQPIPKKLLIISRSRSVRVLRARSISVFRDSFTRPLSALGESSLGSTSSRLLSSPSTNGASTETWRPLTRRVSEILSLGTSIISDSSSLEGWRSFSCSNLDRALLILFREPTWLRGRRTIRLCSASAWRIL